MQSPSVIVLAVVASWLPGPFSPCVCFGRQPPAVAVDTEGTSAPVSGGHTSNNASAVRPQGTMVRPPNSPQHPALEKAWAVYNAAVDDEAAKIRALIAGKFDAAANKGDLEQAETWQAAADLFESSGVLPRHKETQAAVSAAQKRLTEAKTALTGAYGDAMKSLTKEKRIADAQEVRAELKALGTAAGVVSPPPANTALEKSVAQRRRDYAGRDAPPLDDDTVTNQLLSVTDTIARNPGRVPAAMVEVITDEGGLFRALVAAVEAGDDSAVSQALSRFSPDRIKEMDALVAETDWGRWPRKDTQRTNAQVLLAAWDARLRSVQSATNPASGGHAKPVDQVVIEAKDYARSIPADKGLRVAAEWEGLTIPAKAELIWEIDVAAAGEKYLHVLYASEQLRPCEISLNGKRVSVEALGKITGGFMTKDLRWETLGPFSFRRGRNLLSIKPDVVGPHLSRMVISTSKEAPVSEVP